jgi:hypothetical protein
VKAITSDASDPSSSRVTDSSKLEPGLQSGKVVGGSIDGVARIELDVPEDREAAVLAAVAQALAGPPRAAELRQLPWTRRLAEDVVKGMRPAERTLVFRLAEARERRVAVKELTRDFGLAPGAAIDQDFPALSAYCAKRGAAPPITTGGDAGDAWYWLSAAASRHLRAALAPSL